MIQRTNTDLDLIDEAVDELYHMIKDKDDGVGVIRIFDGMPVAEYYADIKDARNSDNLIMTMAKDHMDRKTIRKACYIRYEVMRNE